MKTKAQIHLIIEARENIKTASEKINELYGEYRNAMISIPNSPLGLVFEDGVKNENPNYKIDLLTNYMHQIGYWEGIKRGSENFLYFFDMDDNGFDNYLVEQEDIKKQNEINKLKVLELLNINNGDDVNLEKLNNDLKEITENL
jgi:hypothetical protein